MYPKESNTTDIYEEIEKLIAKAELDGNKSAAAYGEKLSRRYFKLSDDIYKLREMLNCTLSDLLNEAKDKNNNENWS